MQAAGTASTWSLQLPHAVIAEVITLAVQAAYESGALRELSKVSTCNGFVSLLVDLFDALGVDQVHRCGYQCILPVCHHKSSLRAVGNLRACLCNLCINEC